MSKIMDGAELSYPPFERMLHTDFYLPVLTYLILFRLASCWVKTNLFQSFHGFRAYRLHNLSVCFLHSFISGIWSFAIFLWNPNAMLYDAIHWYEPWAVQLPLISIGYFIHDAFDMAQNEISKWTIELILHHMACIVAFLFSVLSRKFTLFTYSALLMEVNSIFLHIRSIMQISGEAGKRPQAYKVVKILNVITFCIFRFGVQFFEAKWGLENYKYIHYSYAVIVFGGLVLLFILHETYSLFFMYQNTVLANMEWA